MGSRTPWQAETGLSWRPHHRLLVLCSQEHATTECLEAAGIDRPARQLPVGAPPTGFEDLAGTDVLLRALLREVDSRADRGAAAELRARHHTTLDLLTSPAHRQGIGRLLPISEAAALGTTRRISRESHTSALWIDQAARLIADCARLVAGAGPLLLDVDGLDRWDRPSLRVLYRSVLVAADERARLVVRGRTACVHRTDKVIGRLRHTFFTHLAERRGVVVHAAPGEPGAVFAEMSAAAAGTDAMEDIVHRSLAEGLPGLLRLVGGSLAMQNFERARLISTTALRMHREALISTGDGSDLPVHIKRLEAISAAQVGDVAEAEKLLGEALGMAARPEDRSHLNYLLALISTKRSYDLATAREYYGRARRAVDDLADPSVEALVERAWVGNGLALVAVMEARGTTDPGIREERFAEAYREELAAFAAVRGLPGTSAFYLRYNLGYNLSFLLEITGRFEQAQSFLASVSSVLLSAERADYGALYEYAIGLLRLRTEDLDGAAQSLRRAIDLAESLNDPFYLERMLSALGYVEHRRGRHSEAVTVFREGVRLARWLRDEDAYQQQLTGLLWSAVLDGRPLDKQILEAAGIWFPTAAPALATGDRDRRIAALTAADAQLLVPSSKLPSYVASVDLEGRPSRDLNRFLAGVATTERPRTEGETR
ncbi:tetratricopeptide repeat protein [Streptomyces sp. CB02460]|uniref:tetratricopeptide repeat protein n=1 Tax=Streptomyces sp. CB02460 TaxID=1703941 RepID=UPI001160F55A|nr:tetratricopeptide repeat protein [Streptomyces sp. CB02460]